MVILRQQHSAFANVVGMGSHPTFAALHMSDRFRETFKICKLRSLRTVDLGVPRSMGASVCYGLNGRFCNSGTEPSLMQRMSFSRRLRTVEISQACDRCSPESVNLEIAVRIR